MSKYITLMNDSSLTDGIGFIHTWIKIENPNENPTFFSFSNSTITSLGGHDSTGSITNKAMTDRPPTTQITLEITDQQYDALKINVSNFIKNTPNYDIFPDNEGDFNCTTAVGYVLAQSDIHYLDGLQNPFASSNRIANTEKLLNTDIMDPTKTPSSDPIISLETALDFKDKHDELRDDNYEYINNAIDNIPALKSIIEKIKNHQDYIDDFSDYLLDLADESQKNGIINGGLHKLESDFLNYYDRLKKNYGQTIKDTAEFIKQNKHLGDETLPFAALGFFTGRLSNPSLSKAEHASSPIIPDLDGDGVETISVSDGVYFDHDGNAFSEKSGWVGKDDGLLVLDINQDGQTDSGRELFGNNTYLKDGTLTKNGYLALQELDDDHNGIIDSADAIWQQLNVWQDKNSNGKVDSGELLSLDSLKISSIATGFTNSTVINDKGNTHRQDSSFRYTGSLQR